MIELWSTDKNNNNHTEHYALHLSMYFTQKNSRCHYYN